MRTVEGPEPVHVDEGEHLTSELWERADDDATAVHHHVDGEWATVSWRQLAERVRAVAGGLVAAGTAPGDRVVVMSSTRLEWTIADLAIVAAGAITVPIYETDASDQCAWVCSNAGVRLALAETTEHAERIEQVRDEAPDLGEVLVIEEGGLDELARRAGDDELEEVDRRLHQLDGEAVASIVYTSGTTGRPKGCVLTHRNLVWSTRQATSALEPLFEDEDSSTLLFLPLAHIFTRVVQYGCLQRGVALGYARSMEDLSEDVETFRPTFLLGVPRVFEKIHNNARRQASGGVQRRVFEFADDAADEVVDEDTGLVTKAKAKAADTLVYEKVRESLGGRLHTFISGGAPLSGHLARFFEAAGITILQGYGLTETSSVITVDRPTAPRRGTVGPPLPGIEIGLADDDEVLTRGEHVFQGYHRNQEATDEVLGSDGWYHTEDLGEIDEDGVLTLVGRKKDLIVTAGGKNVAPEPIEEAMKGNRLISQPVLIGDDRPFVAALIALDEEELASFAEERGIDAPADELPDHEDVRAEVERAIEDANETVSRAESIREFRILRRELSQEQGELTPTMKPKREVITEHFVDEVEDIYS